MADQSQFLPSPHGAWLKRIEWCQITKPGSYLHLSSGLIARVYAEDLVGMKACRQSAGMVVLLADNPRTPIVELRDIAHRHGLHVNS